MASREIKDLHPQLQVLYNKFHDRCRRDSELLRLGVSVVLACTYRTQEEQNKVGGKSRHTAVTPQGKPAAEAFTVFLLQYGVPSYDDTFWKLIEDHGRAVGLRVNHGVFEL